MKKFYLLSALLSASVAAFAQTFVPTTTTKKNVVLEEFTGINCTFCPDGHAIANQLATSNAGRVFPINIHTGSYATTNIASQNFTTTVGNSVAARMGIDGYPTGTVNRDKISGDNTYAIGRDLWTRRVSSHLAMDAVVNVAARCTLNLSTRELKVNVESYYTGNSIGTMDKLNVFIVQDNVEGPQIGSAYNPSQVLPNGNYLHNHMLRASLTDTWGEDLAPITQGSFHNKTYTVTIPNKYGAIDAVLTDLKVIAFITDSTHIVLNGNKAQMTYITNEAMALNIANAQIGANNDICNGVSSANLQILGMGNTAITDIRGYYTMNSVQMPFTHTFANPVALAQMGTFNVNNIVLPNAGNNTITFTINEINGQSVSPINKAITFAKAQSVSNSDNKVKVIVNFDKYPRENKLIITNITDNRVVLQKTFTQADSLKQNQIFEADLIDGKCYSVSFQDTYGDGICCSYGSGNVSFKVGEEVLLAPTGNFTSEATVYLNFTQLVAVNKANLAQNINLFPNPTTGLVNIQLALEEAQHLNMDIINTLGQVVQQAQTIEVVAGENTIQLPVHNLPNGMYFVRLYSQKGQEVLPFTLNK